MALFVQEWGSGDPLIALHPLGLESSAFEGLAAEFAERGLRTLAVDLPGFGKTPLPDAPLTPARLARPVVALARRMETPPALIGISMGGRVALEAALRAPDRFRAVVAIAPYLPWRRFRWALPLARFMSPSAIERIPVEKAWPVLRWVADQLVHSPRFEDDAIARAGARMIYYFSCPASRSALVSAAREMALDPAFGRRGLWERLPKLSIPATFVWGLRDRLVPIDFARPVASVLPEARQLMLPCLQHALNGPHGRCLADAVASTLVAPERVPAGIATVWGCEVEGEASRPTLARDPATA